MDMEDESIAYLKFLNDGPQNYLLQSNEDGLNDTIPVEPIFTEIDATVWPTEGFPILLNGTLLTEESVDDDNESSDKFNETEINNDNASSTTNDQESQETVAYFSNEGGSSDKNIISSSNGLFLSNDVILKLDRDIPSGTEANNTVEIEQNDGNVSNETPSHVCITYTPVLDDNYENTLDLNLNGNAKKSEIDVIQLINIDGTVTTINKQLFDTLQINTNENSNLEKLYSEVKAHKCKLCSYLCESLNEIKLHLTSQHSNAIVTENGKIADDQMNLVGTKMTSILNSNNQRKYTMFLCSECKYGFASKQNLKEHMITVHRLTYSLDTAKEENTIINAEIIKTDNEKKPAELSTKSMTATSILKAQQRAMKKVKCSIKGCPLRFAKDELRKRHEECHVNQEKKQFMCPICNSKFSIWRICNMHLWKTHNIDLGLFCCPMCNKYKSNTMAAVVNHMISHKEEKPFMCSSCGKTYKHYTDLKNHSAIHKTSEETPDTQCEFCERRFSDSKCLKKHIKFVHDKFKPFICNICGHETARKAMLQLHYRQHTGDKPHKCSYCDYKTGDHNCLRKHIMRHVGDTKYSCPHCKYQSIQSSAYKMHLATKHPGKEGTYFCSICTYSSVNAASYFSHVKCHELEKKKNANGKVDKIDNKQNGREDVGSKPNKSNKENLLNDVEDDEIQNGFLNNYSQSEEAVDTGGITIPAGLEIRLAS